MRNIGYYHSVLNGRIEIKLWSGRFLSFFSFLIKLLYIIHQKTPRTVKKKTEAPQVDVEGLSFPSYFRYSKAQSKKKIKGKTEFIIRSRFLFYLHKAS